MSKVGRHLILTLGVLTIGIGLAYLHVRVNLIKLGEKELDALDRFPYGDFGDPVRDSLTALTRDDYRFIVAGGFSPHIPGTKLSGHVTRHYGWRTLGNKPVGCTGAFFGIEAEQADSYAEVYNRAISGEILRVFNATNATEVNRFFAELKAPGNVR